MVISILTFIVVLTFLVLIHELGHYGVARILGVKVEEFGLGLPPRIKGKKIGPTIYSLNALPIGGFVKLAGEDDTQDEHPEKMSKEKRRQYFFARGKKERAAILSAGVFMNLLVAYLITAGLLLSGVHVPSGKVRIDSIVPDGPAAAAGIREGDIITALLLPQGNEVEITTSQTLIGTIRAQLGKEIGVRYVRDGIPGQTVIVPRIEYPSDQGPTGITINDMELRKYSLTEAPVEALKVTANNAWMMIRGIGQTLYGLVSGQGKDVDIAGPIGIAQVTGQAVKFGWRAVIEFAGILSLNLAILNILPIPALDGGRLLFVFLEKLLGRKVKPAFEKQTHQIGMLVLLFLVLLISVNDVMRIVRGG